MSDRTYRGEITYYLDRLGRIVNKLEALDQLPVDHLELTEFQGEVLKQCVQHIVSEAKELCPHHVETN